MVSRRVQFFSITEAKKANFGHGVTTLIFPGKITELEMEALEIAVK
jgi:diphthamide biosynthesis methyltransferase